MKKLLIIDYEAGNLFSVVNAFNQVSRNTQIRVSGDLAEIKKADKLVLPGVGSFRHCALSLEAKKNLKQVILDKIEEQTPVLGICVGMQLLFKQSFEGQKTNGFAVFKQSIQAFKDQKECKKLKIPHMGWNQINLQNSNQPHHLLFKGIDSGSYVYFANSYFAPVSKNSIATTDYGVSFSAVVAKDNLMGVQFHPEKSQKIGLQIIQNFLDF